MHVYELILVIVLIVLLLAVFIMCFALLVKNESTNPSHSTVALNHDFYEHNDAYRILGPDTEYCKHHGYVDIENPTHYARMSKNKPVVELEYILAMCNGADVVVTTSKTDGEYDCILISQKLRKKHSGVSIGLIANKVISKEITKLYSRIERKNWPIHDTIEQMLKDYPEYRCSLDNGFPVRLGKLCIINGYNLYETCESNLVDCPKDIPYPRSKHNNGLAKALRPATKKSRSQKIPKIIHQTFESLVIPHAITPCMRSLLDLNPDYEFRYYTGEDCRDYVRKHFDKEVLEAYDRLNPNAYKADLWRLCVLYNEGGIYIDCKLLANKAFSDYIDSDTDFFCTIDLKLWELVNNCGIFNAFLGSVPKHPFIKQLIDGIVHNVKTRNYGTGLLNITGPTFIKQEMCKFLNEDKFRDMYECGKYKNELGTVQIFELGITANSLDPAIINDKGQILVHRRNIYDNRSHNLGLFQKSSGKPHYGVLYRRKQVYIE